MARSAPLAKRAKGRRYPTDTVESAKLGMTVQGSAEPGEAGFGKQAKRRRDRLRGYKGSTAEEDQQLIGRLRKDLRRA